MDAPLVSGQACSYAALAAFLGFLSLALGALLAAAWRYIRAGYELYRLSGHDWANVWADLRGIERANIDADRVIREGMKANYTGDK